MKMKQYYKTRYESAVACRSKIDKCPVSTREDKRLVVSTELNSVTGRVVRRSEFQTINRQEEMKNYKVSDFSLDNLLAVGANLVPIGTLQCSSLQASDNIEQQVRKIENSINKSNN